MAQPAAKLYPKVGPRRMMIVAFSGNMAMTIALAFIDYGTSDWLMAPENSVAILANMNAIV